MDISERIAKIIASEGLTASAFADKIGVQRSNISHIMNGRSGPSLELLQKVLSAFPHYNTEWLLMGRGEIYRQPVQTSIFDVIGEPEPEPVKTPANAVAAKMQTTNNEPRVQQPELFADESITKAGEQQAAETPSSVAAVAEQAVKREAEVKQIVVLYSDNTFVAYNKQ